MAKIMASQELSYKALMVAVVDQAYKDIFNSPPRTKLKDIYSAMEFLLDETCECYCSAINKNYDKLWRQVAKVFRQRVG